MNSLDAINLVIKAIRKKYPKITESENPTNPGFALFVERMIGQDQVANVDIWLGYAMHLAVVLGALSHKEAEEIMNGKPHDLQAPEARELLDLGANGRIRSVTLRIDEGELEVRCRRKRGDISGKYTVEKFSAVVGCIRAAIYLLCTRSANRPRS